MLQLAAYAGIGAFGGFFGGLLGIGGGVLFTPMLVVAYAGAGFDPRILVQMSIATTMGIICLGAIGAALTHARAGAVDWRIGALLLPAVGVGAFLGAQAAPSIPGKAILALLLAFLAWQAGKLLTGSSGGAARPEPAREPKAPRVPAAKIVPLGLVIGAVSSVGGIGGGVILVPMLVDMGVPVKRAIGTSSLNTFSLSLFATAGYLAPLGEIPASVPGQTIGLVYLPALAAAGAFALLAAVAGAKSTHLLPAKALRKILGALLILVGLRLLWFLFYG